MGSQPGAGQQFNAQQVRRLRQELQSVRDANAELKDSLHETRQDLIALRRDRDALLAQNAKFKTHIANFEVTLKERVQRAVQAHAVDLKETVARQAAELATLKEHNSIFKETVEYLEGQLKNT